MNELVLIYRFLTDYSTVIKYFDLATLPIITNRNGVWIQQVQEFIPSSSGLKPCLNCPNVFHTSTPKKKKYVWQHCFTLKQSNRRMHRTYLSRFRLNVTLTVTDKAKKCHIQSNI